MDEPSRTTKKEIQPSFRKPFCNFAYILRSNTKNAGFTLIEVVIAMGIFGITLISTVAGISQMHLLQETGRNLSQASFHAQRIAEEIKLQADTSIDTAENINWTAWASNNGCNTLENENASISFTSLSNNLTEVAINVTWNTKDHPMSYQVVTRIAGS